MAPEAVCALDPVTSALMVFHKGGGGSHGQQSGGLGDTGRSPLPCGFVNRDTAFAAGTQKTFTFSLYFVKL